MGEYVDIAYDGWILAFQNIDKSSLHGSSPEKASRIINYVCGSSMVTRTLDLKCAKEVCCNLNVTILFPRAGTYVVPIPVGFKLDDEDLDLRIKDYAPDEQAKPRGH
ncbi:MAG: hypothetical protein ACE5KG_01765 [Nitrososphaerales archaeon]